MDTNITEISDITDIDLSPGVIEKFLDELPDKLFRFGFKLVIAIIVLAIGLQLIKLIRKILRKSLEKANVDEGIIHFTNSLLKVILMFALFVVVIATCGVEISSFLAVLGSVSVAIGFAWQGSLSNLAGGLLILVLKPFHIGERIVDEKGNDGVVEEVDIFYTKIVTADQRVIVCRTDRSRMALSQTIRDVRIIGLIFRLESATMPISGKHGRCFLICLNIQIRFSRKRINRLL